MSSTCTVLPHFVCSVINFTIKIVVIQFVNQGKLISMDIRVSEEELDKYRETYNMITVNELRSVLKSFGFKEKEDKFTNTYTKGASIEVDFRKKTITYAPVDEDFKEGIFPAKEKPSKGFVIHRNTTLNFSTNESFVCLVCVHLLLKKGYEAKHIIIEPTFKVGHVNKPSYGDVLILDKEYSPLVLIENKTFGTEFSKEWNLMQKDGGQLFSYLGPLVNEMGLCENLALFAADFDDKDIILKSHIICLKIHKKGIFCNFT